MSTRELPGSPHSLYEFGDHNLLQNVQSCRTQDTCGRISNSLTGFSFTIAFVSDFTSGLPLALVSLSFAFALALSFGLTFAHDDSVNFHVVRTSVPGFLRAQITLDRLYRFLVVGANFKRNRRCSCICGGAFSIRVDPARCQISVRILASLAATMTVC